MVGIKVKEDKMARRWVTRLWILLWPAGISLVIWGGLLGLGAISFGIVFESSLITIIGAGLYFPCALIFIVSVVRSRK